MKLTQNITMIVAALLLAVFATTASADNSHKSHDTHKSHKSHKSDKHHHGNHSDDPDNLIKAMTFISTRPFVSVDGLFFEDGLFGGDGMNFFKNVLGLSDQEIEDRRNAAIAFYAERFGIDVNDPRIHFTGFQIDPDADYRVIMMTGKGKGNDPKEGFPILDGGFAAAVIDPAGIELGGEFEGTWVPAGTMFASGGSYVIKRGKQGDDIVINYQSRGPMQPVGTGGIINCEVMHPEWGEGLGWGYFEFHNLSDGRITSQVRNVLTFPGLGFEETMIEQN